MANSTKKSGLLPEMLPVKEAGRQPDLFVVESAKEWSVKDDTTSMEYPLYSLSKSKDVRIRNYSRGGKTIRVIPSAVGAPTMFDKDILIYAISHIVKARNAELQPSRRLRIDVGDFLSSCGRSRGGASYTRVLDMCRRLKGVVIETNVRTTESERTDGFGLLDDYQVLEPTKDRKGALVLEITLSEWLYRHAGVDFDVLTLHPLYFDLSPQERRLYELARKHCGQKPWWACSLPVLREKFGSTQPAKRFKQDVKGLIQANRMPDYWIALCEESNQLVFVSHDNNRVLQEADRAGKLKWLEGLMQQRIRDAEKGRVREARTELSASSAKESARPSAALF